MNKFIAGLAAVKLLFLAAFVSIIFSACQTAQLSSQTIAEPTAAPTAIPLGTSDTNINRATSEPYKGDLSIFEGEERAKNLQVDRVMGILKISEGKAVADIGAGSGWFTVRAARKVGDKGKVYAVEINEDAIKYINDRAGKENIGNIQTVFGAEDDPKLAENSIDAALLLKTYHEISQPVKVLGNLRKALRKGALVGIIDRNGSGEDHGVKKEIVIEEAKRAGFVLADEYDFVKGDGMDYFLAFRSSVQ